MFSHIFVWCHSPPCHQKNLFRKTELSPSAGSSSWFCKFADQLVWIPSKNSIWLLQDASKLETPLPQKKTMRPGGYKPGKMTAVLKRKVSEFCQKKSLIASGKNKALTWLDVGFLCCCFLSNEPLELPQTKVLDVLLADSQSKISHIASKRLWLWWSAGFFWGNFRGFLSQTLGTLNLEPQET